MLADELVLHFDMFSPGVENEVVSEVDVAHIVQILEYALEPYSFACGDYRASIFSFHARQCDCRLLLATLGDHSTA